MKRTVILFSVLMIAGIFLFYSCKKKTDSNIYLTDDDLAWQIYHLGDTLKFLSNQNHHRTYVVNRINHQMLNWDWVGYEDIKHEDIEVLIQRVDSTYDDNIFLMEFCRGIQPDRLQFIILITPVYELPVSMYDIIGQSITIDTLTINNVLYHNALLYDMNEQHLPACVYYHKQKGWLRLVTLSGEIWDRVN